MPSNKDIFNTNTSDLGYDMYQSGATKDDIDSLFLLDNAPTHKCLVCGNTAKYRLIPKHTHLNTAEIEDKGFVCEYCISMKYVSPSDYGLRPIE